MPAARPPRACTGARCGVRRRAPTTSIRWACWPARRSGSSRCIAEHSLPRATVFARNTPSICVQMGTLAVEENPPTVETMTTDAHRSRPLRFGLHTALPRGTDFGAFAISVQEAGFDVLTIPDHLVASVVAVRRCDGRRGRHRTPAHRNTGAQQRLSPSRRDRARSRDRRGRLRWPIRVGTRRRAT